MVEKLVPYTAPAQYGRKEKPHPAPQPLVKRPPVPRYSRPENNPPRSPGSSHSAPQTSQAPQAPQPPQSHRKTAQTVRQTRKDTSRTGSRPEARQQQRLFDVYEPDEPIHRSKDGTEIFTCFHRLTKAPVVLKGIDISKHPRPKDLKLAVHKHSSLCHPNVCRLVECWDSMRLVLVLEHIEGMTLAHFMAEIGCELDQAREIIRQAAEGLAHCHAQGVSHHDLRLENIMLQSGEQPCVKLIDFCSSVPAGRSKRALARTAYAAPEAASGEHDAAAADVFALGVVAHALLLGAFPSPPAEGELPLPPELPAQAAALLRGMLSVDPVVRLTSQQVCDEEWLSGKSLAKGGGNPADEADEVAVEMLDFEVLQELEVLGLRDVSASVEKGLLDDRAAAYKVAVLRKLRLSYLLPAAGEALAPRAAAAQSPRAVARAPPGHNSLTPVTEAEEVAEE